MEIESGSRHATSRLVVLPSTALTPTLVLATSVALIARAAYVRRRDALRGQQPTVMSAGYFLLSAANRPANPRAVRLIVDGIGFATVAYAVLVVPSRHTKPSSTDDSPGS